MSCELSQCLTTDSLSTTAEFLFSRAWQQTPSISGEGSFHSTSKRWLCLGNWDEQNFCSVPSRHGSHGSPPTHTIIAVQLLFWGGRSRKGSPGSPRAPPSCSVRGSTAPAVAEAKPHCSFQCLWDVVNAPWLKNFLPKGTKISQEPFILPKGERSERFLAHSAPSKNVHPR